MEKLICKRCGYEWWPREPDKVPKKCPHCTSVVWDKEKKNSDTSKRKGAV